MARSVIVSAARTPIGKLSGALAPLAAADLGGIAIGAALERAGLAPEDVDHVVMGQVLQAGQGQNPARQAAARAGVPMSVPAVTLNDVCLSGLHAVLAADQMVRAGDAGVVVAGGMESMTNAPHVLPGARAGFRLGDATLVDTLVTDGLWCAFDHMHMGAGTESYARTAGIARSVQDEWAARSHERAAVAQKESRFGPETVPVTVPQRKGDPVVVKADEGIRADTTVDGLGRLKPAFTRDGTITAGNASQISDGAAAVIVMSAERAAGLGISPAAELAGFGLVAGPDPSLLTQPSRAINAALEGAGRSVADVDLFELNEAFAAQMLACNKDLKIDESKLNVHGGAVALGHPIGASGARVLVTLLHALEQRGLRRGLASLCLGGGNAVAMVVERV